MPSIPKTQTLNATSVDILNAIRNSASDSYRDYVPVAAESDASLREIGAVIMEYPALQNEFLDVLVNRIGRVIITNKMYTNPWAMFKRGTMEFGETIEEIFVDLAKPFEYDPSVAEKEVFKREMPSLKVAFHIINYKKFYKVTVQREQLRQAFLSWEGINNLITKIIDSMYAASNYDEFQAMKYMLAIHLLNGNFYPVTIPTVSDTNMKAIASAIKGVSNNIEFMSGSYNKAGVSTYTNKNSQYLIVNSKFDASMDVDVLSSAFNMDKADFFGHRVMIDGFGSLDTKRLDLLFEEDPNYHKFTQEELKALDTIPAVLVDKDWFMILDNLYDFSSIYNGQGLYWNYFLHVWKTFSASPFNTAIAFVPGTPTVNSVTVSPTSVSASAGQQIQLSAKVNTENFASQEVTWSSNNEEYATVDVHGLVTLSESATGSIEITATSVYDKEKTAKCTITVE